MADWVRGVLRTAVDVPSEPESASHAAFAVPVGPESHANPATARLMVTPRARRALARICGIKGRQALVLSWPGGATCLPAATYEPGAFDVIIGHVAGCPIHSDVRQLDYYRDRSAVIDTSRTGRRASGVFLLRPPVAGGAPQ